MKRRAAPLPKRSAQVTFKPSHDSRRAGFWFGRGLQIVRQEQAEIYEHNAQGNAKTIGKSECDRSVRIDAEGEARIVDRFSAHDLPDI